MKNKKFWLGILAIMLIFGIMVVGCDGEEEEDNPALTGTVSITGNAIVGQTLTANTTNLGGSGTISYQWRRSGTTNIGTNSSTYEVQAADIDSTITVTVTRSGNSGSVTSEATAVVVSDTLPALTGSVSITGNAMVGQTLTANTDSLEGSGTIFYQWKSGSSSTATGTDIIDADESSYTLVDADEGKYITVTVTRSGNSGSVTSPSTSAVAPYPLLTGTVSITGTAKVGQTLTANTDSLEGSGTIFYQWRRTSVGGSSFTDITEANEETYLIKTDDFGRLINVVVTRSENSGNVTSPSTSTVADVMVWTQVSQSVFSNRINSIAVGGYSVNKRWVAVSEDSGGRIASSTDGLTWDVEDYVNLSGINRSVATNDSIWYAVGSNGRMFSSPNGQAPWAIVNLNNVFDNYGSQLTINDIAYGNGSWIVVGSGRVGVLGWDFDTWTQVTHPLMTTTDVYYNLAAEWMIVGGRNMAISNTQGATWSSVDVSGVFGGNTDTIQTVAYGVYGTGTNRRWIAAGNNGKMAVSPILSTEEWTLIPNSPFGTGTIRALVYANNKWVAVGSESSNAFGESGNRIAISTDGINWTSVANTGFANNQQIYAIAYADGKWIAVGDGGRIAYAIDD